jgi:6-phosphogluconolactonase
MLPRDTRVLADAQAVAEQARALISAVAAQAIAERGVFRIVLAGGTTPQQAYALLAMTAQDWARWQVFWGDERCVPVADPQRNSQWRWSGAQHFPIPAELGAQIAATQYAQTVAQYLPFDLVLLGMGEDGHTASLFPGADFAQGLSVAIYHAPKPPAERVSLTIEALQACRQQLVLVTGAGKAQAVAAWRAGAMLPIAAAVGADAWVLLDQAAAC